MNKYANTNIIPLPLITTLQQYAFACMLAIESKSMRNTCKIGLGKTHEETPALQP